MSTETTFKNGKCGLRNIRIKIWKSGFSIKCLKGEKTIVGRPCVQHYLRYDLVSFCDNCKYAKQDSTIVS